MATRIMGTNRASISSRLANRSPHIRRARNCNALSLKFMMIVLVPESLVSQQRREQLIIHRPRSPLANHRRLRIGRCVAPPIDGFGHGDAALTVGDIGVVTERAV